MKNVLVIKSSVGGEAGNSSKLTNNFLAALEEKTQVSITTVDLSVDTLPHLTGEEAGSWFVDPAERNEQQKALAAISEQQIEKVKAADMIVLGVPMYNFTLPSTLKSWLDRVARAGITFNYTDQGPVGLLENKQVFVMAARGGVYQGTDMDTQTPLLKMFFNLIGLSDIEFVYAEGLNMGDEATEQAWAKSNEKIIELIEKVPA